MAGSINDQYFSGTQASLFIGDVWVDDILAVEYMVNQSKVPKYGYGSQHFDFVAKGAILINGTFTINFREPNYLWLILERYKTFNKSREIRLKGQEAAYNEEQAKTYTNDKRQRFDQFFLETNPDKARTRMIEQSREFNGITENTQIENFNHTGFDILLGYGSELTADSPGETIKGVQVMGKSKVINSDGRPIAEQYSFIARKLV